jgi:hypothetical protein
VIDSTKLAGQARLGAGHATFLVVVEDTHILLREVVVFAEIPFGAIEIAGCFGGSKAES